MKTEFIFNAFSSRSKDFALRAEGNPAAVILDTNNFSDKEKSKIAIEKNQPIIVFLKKISNNEYQIDYFSPSGKRELLCGHGTIAANMALEYLKEEGGVKYLTHSGMTIDAFIKPENHQYSISLPRFQVSSLKNLSDTMKIFITNHFGKANCEIKIFKNIYLNDIILQLNDFYPLFELTINDEDVKRIFLEEKARSLSITSLIKEEPKADYQTKLFYSQLESLEDIACGSINSSIAGIWSELLQKENLINIFPYQCHKTHVYGGIQSILVRKDNIVLSNKC